MRSTLPQVDSISGLDRFPELLDQADRLLHRTHSALYVRKLGTGLKDPSILRVRIGIGVPPGRCRFPPIGCFRMAIWSGPSRARLGQADPNRARRTRVCSRNKEKGYFERQFHCHDLSPKLEPFLMATLPMRGDRPDFAVLGSRNFLLRSAEIVALFRIPCRGC